MLLTTAAVANAKGYATQPASTNAQAPRLAAPRAARKTSGPSRNITASAANVEVIGAGIPDRRTRAGVLPGLSLQHNDLGVPTGTPIQVRLQQPVDSARAKNGDTVQGVLTAPLGKIPAGAPVQLTVVAAAKAGQLTSYGELSLQVISVNGEQILSDVITAEGREGAKILPDAAPDPGTEAIFTPDQTITLPAA